MKKLKSQEENKPLLFLSSFSPLTLSHLYQIQMPSLEVHGQSNLSPGTERENPRALKSSRDIVKRGVLKYNPIKVPYALSGSPLNMDPILNTKTKGQTSILTPDWPLRGAST